MSAQAARKTSRLEGLGWAVSDSLTMAWRNLIRYFRIPSLLLGATLQPIMFVVLFAYVFGGAIRVPGGFDYIDYLMPGIFVQSAIFGSMQTGVGLADDIAGGAVDRFRSLPMSSSAVLVGRTLSDAARNLFVVLLMTGVGYLIGFRFNDGLLNAIIAMLLVVAFGYAFSWIAAVVGLLAGNAESAQSLGFVWVFPLTFASSVFVPVESMPGWLQTFAGFNPISLTVDALRTLALGDPEIGGPLWPALLWTVGLIAVFAPLAVRLYRRA